MLNPMRSRSEIQSSAEASGVRATRAGFSLAEMLAAMMIGAMVLVAVLGIYHRAERSAAAVTRRLDASRLPREVLQRIAEDVDGMISSGSDAEITIQNKLDNLYPTARLVISRTFTDRANRPQKFEEIVWQSGHDFDSLTPGLVLYRSHTGIAAEDKVLDKNKEDWEKELYVPLCSGVTFFRISALQGDKLLDKWSGQLPPGIQVSLSFAEPFKKVDGALDVPEEEKIIRTIAVDRTRKIKFTVAESTQGDDQEEAPPEDTPDVDKGKKPAADDSKEPAKVRL